MRKLKEQFQQHFGEEAEKHAAKTFTSQQLQYKIKNMLVNGHWKLENGVVKRSDEQRQGKRNQEMAFASFSERSAQALRDRAEVPYEQVAAKEQQHHWARTQQAPSMIAELARQRGRDIFGTDQYMERALWNEEPWPPKP